MKIILNLFVVILTLIVLFVFNLFDLPVVYKCTIKIYIGTNGLMKNNVFTFYNLIGKFKLSI